MVASPTYKATYTGLLKLFLDQIGADELAGVVTVPVMVGAGAAHALAVETHLRPVLVELGATMPTRGLYLQEADLAELTPVLDALVGPGRGPDAPPAAAEGQAGSRGSSSSMVRTSGSTRATRLARISSMRSLGTTHSGQLEPERSSSRRRAVGVVSRMRSTAPSGRTISFSSSTTAATVTGAPPARGWARRGGA